MHRPCIKIIHVCLVGLSLVWGCGKPEDAAREKTPVTNKIIPQNTSAAKPMPPAPVGNATQSPIGGTAAPATQVNPAASIPTSTAGSAPAAQQSTEGVLTPPAANVTAPSATGIAAPSADSATNQPASDAAPRSAAAPPSDETAAQSSEDSQALELYNPIGKIDPFAPLFREEQVVANDKAADKAKKTRRTHLTPLEKVDLSQLKLLGTILAPSGNRAMVADTGGKGYVVTIGTYIGMSSGRIVDILSDRIVVEEEVENLLGKLSLRKRELTIPKPLGE